jgi:FSR family fosmidomycin resistance protein-like MFS transporter
MTGRADSFPAVEKAALPPRSPFWAVAAGHMTNDVFMSMGPVLLTFISLTYLPITAAVIGLILSLREGLGAVSQPIFGLASDKTGGRWIGTMSVIWTAGLLMLSLVLVQSRQFWLLAIPFALSGVGSGAFHPVGTKYASETLRGKAGSSLALFFVFGQVGLAIGPALAGFLLEDVSATSGKIPFIASPFGPLFLVALIALPVGAWMASTIPTRRMVRESQRIAAANAVEEAPRKAVLWGAVVLVALLVMGRAVANISTVSFLPTLFARKGWSPAEYGLIASAFWFASAMGNLLIGWLADRHSPRILIAVSMALAIPALFTLPLADGSLAFVLAMLAGALLGGTHSTLVLLAQHVIPTGRGLSGGAILGYMFISGALGNVLVGGLADGFRLGGITVPALGLGTMFQVMAGVAGVVVLLTLALPKGIGADDRQESVIQIS